MSDTKHYRQTLIQRYIDQTITNEELSELQELLKSDVTVRNELLLYVRMDIAIRDYVLFHNYMDEPSSSETSSPEKASPTQNEAVLPELKSILGKVFDPVPSL